MQNYCFKKNFIFLALVMEKMKDIQYTHPSDSDRI